MIYLYSYLYLASQHRSSGCIEMAFGSKWITVHRGLYT